MKNLPALDMSTRANADPTRTGDSQQGRRCSRAVAGAGALIGGLHSIIATEMHGRARASRYGRLTWGAGTGSAPVCGAGNGAGWVGIRNGR